MASSGEAGGEKTEYPTFSEPWEFSDLVIAACDKKYHVHKVGVELFDTATGS